MDMTPLPIPFMWKKNSPNKRRIKRPYCRLGTSRLLSPRCCTGHRYPGKKRGELQRWCERCHVNCHETIWSHSRGNSGTDTQTATARKPSTDIEIGVSDTSDSIIKSVNSLSETVLLAFLFVVVVVLFSWGVGVPPLSLP